MPHSAPNTHSAPCRSYKYPNAWNSLSSKHCSLEFDAAAGAFIVLDSSTNGTFVNGERIGRGSVGLLRPGDRLGLSIVAPPGAAGAPGIVDTVEYELRSEPAGMPASEVPAAASPAAAAAATGAGAAAQPTPGGGSSSGGSNGGAGDGGNGDTPCTHKRRQQDISPPAAGKRARSSSGGAAEVDATAQLRQLASHNQVLRERNDQLRAQLDAAEAALAAADAERARVADAGRLELSQLNEARAADAAAAAAAAEQLRHEIAVASSHASAIQEEVERMRGELAAAQEAAAAAQAGRAAAEAEVGMARADAKSARELCLAAEATARAAERQLAASERRCTALQEGLESEAEKRVLLRVGLASIQAALRSRAEQEQADAHDLATVRAALTAIAARHANGGGSEPEEQLLLLQEQLGECGTMAATAGADAAAGTPTPGGTMVMTGSGMAAAGGTQRKVHHTPPPPQQQQPADVSMTQTFGTPANAGATAALLLHSSTAPLPSRGNHDTPPAPTPPSIAVGAALPTTATRANNAVLPELTQELLPGDANAAGTTLQLPRCAVMAALAAAAGQQPVCVDLDMKMQDAECDDDDDGGGGVGVVVVAREAAGSSGPDGAVVPDCSDVAVQPSADVGSPAAGLLLASEPLAQPMLAAEGGVEPCPLLVPAPQREVCNGRGAEDNEASQQNGGMTANAAPLESSGTGNDCGHSPSAHGRQGGSDATDMDPPSAQADGMQGRGVSAPPPPPPTTEMGAGCGALHDNMAQEGRAEALAMERGALSCVPEAVVGTGGTDVDDDAIRCDNDDGRESCKTAGDDDGGDCRGGHEAGQSDVTGGGDEAGDRRVGVQDECYSHEEADNANVSSEGGEGDEGDGLGPTDSSQRDQEALDCVEAVPCTVQGRPLGQPAGVAFADVSNAPVASSQVGCPAACASPASQACSALAQAAQPAGENLYF